MGKIILKLIYSLCFLFLLPLQLTSQNDIVLHEIVTNFKQDEDYVRKIVEDKLGMLWFQTTNTIYRYNGTLIEDFNNKVFLDYKLTEAYLADDRIVLNYNNERLRLFNIYTLNVSDLHLPQNLKNFKKIYYKNKDSIYFQTRNGILLAKLESDRLVEKEIVALTPFDNFTPISKFAFLFVRDGKIMYGDTRNIISKDIMSYDAPICFANNKDLVLVTTLSDVVIIDKHKNVLKINVSKFAGEGFFYCNFILGNFFIVSNLRIIKINPETLKIEYFNFAYPKGFSVSLDWSFAFYMNNNGDFYLNNHRTLFRGSLNNFYISNYSRIKIDGEGIANVRTAFYDSIRNDIVLGAENFGVVRFENKNGIYAYKNVFNVPHSSNPQDAVFNHISQLRNKSFFLSSNSCTYLLGNSTKVINISAIWDVYNEYDSVVWCVGNGISGILKYNILNNTSILYTPNISTKEKMSSWDIEPFMDYFFVSTTNGLFVFNKKTLEFSSIKQFANLNFELSSRVWYSKVINDEVLYVATQGNGVYKINLKNSCFSQQPINSLSAFQIEAFDSNYIWIVSSGKLTFLNGYGQAFDIRVSRFDLPNEIAFHGISLLPNYNLIVCGNEGFSIINVKEFVKKVTHFKTFTNISKFSVNGKISFGFLPNYSSIKLPYDSNTLNFEISNSLLDDASEIKIMYKLYGYDDNFHVIENVNNITFKSLPSGVYRLDIFVCNSIGIWDDYATQVFLEIYPPWYFSFIVKLIFSIILISAFIFFSFQIRSRLEIRKNRELLLIETELKGIRSQLNPHFIFNSLNSIQSHILDSSSKVALAYLNKFAKLLRKILDYSSVEAIAFKLEIAWIEEYLELEKLRFENTFIWHIIIDESIKEDSLIPALVLQPIIENALIHGLFPKKSIGKITISYKLGLDNKSVICEVQDDGVGRGEFATKQFTKHNSIGMRMTEKRLFFLSKKYNLNCEMQIEDLFSIDNNGEGTIVTIILPLLHK